MYRAKPGTSASFKIKVTLADKLDLVATLAASNIYNIGLYLQTYKYRPVKRLSR